MELMPFEKGNKIGQGRPKGANNKTTDIEKAELLIS